MRLLVVKLRVAFEKRFEEFLDHSSTVNCAIIASCSHPNFKMCWVSREKRNSVHSLMVRTMEDVRTLVGENNQQADSSSGDDFFLLILILINTEDFRKSHFVKQS